MQGACREHIGVFRGHWGGILVVLGEDGVRRG